MRRECAYIHTRESSFNMKETQLNTKSTQQMGAKLVFINGIARVKQLRHIATDRGRPRRKQLPSPTNTISLTLYMKSKDATHQRCKGDEQVLTSQLQLHRHYGTYPLQHNV